MVTWEDEQAQGLPRKTLKDYYVTGKRFNISSNAIVACLDLMIVPLMKLHQIKKQKLRKYCTSHCVLDENNSDGEADAIEIVNTLVLFKYQN